MAPTSANKRKYENGARPKRAKKPRKVQKNYFSSSDSEGDGEFKASDAPKPRHESPAGKQGGVNGASKSKRVIKSKKSEPKGILRARAPDDPIDEHDSDSEDNGPENEQPLGSDSELDSDEDAFDVDPKRRTVKRHDPSVFANSMATILSSKLPTSKRADPVLVRSTQPQTANQEMEESKLEAKARRKLRDEKRQAKEKGRVRDVLLGDAPDLTNEVDEQGNGKLTAAAIAEQEKRLRKTAQRGVVKLFNAVRAAQVKGEDAARSMRDNGVVGQQKREEKAGEMSRQSFLDMISSGKAKT